jgi:CIC family chloride channel protein
VLEVAGHGGGGLDVQDAGQAVAGAPAVALAGGDGPQVSVLDRQGDPAARQARDVPGYRSPEAAGGDGSSAAGGLPDFAAVAGPVGRQLDPQAIFAGESLGQALRQLEVYGRGGLPVISGDGRHIEGWVTNTSVLQALARQLTTAQAETARAQLAADWAHEDLESSLREPPAPVHGYQLAEITLDSTSPAAGRRIADVAWPAGSVPVTVLRGGRLRPTDPGTVLRTGDRISLLVPAPRGPGAARDGARPA